MSLSFEGKKVRAVIRSLMKKNGYLYSDLAKILKVSEPTVKRFMTRDDFTLERLIAISDWLGLSLSELVELANHDSSVSNRFSEAQEEYFVRNPKAFLYFHLLLTGNTPTQIANDGLFKNAEVRKILSGLEKAGLIEVWPNDRVRLKLRGVFSMRPGGVMEKTYFEKAVQEIWRHARSRVKGYSYAHAPDSPLLFRPFELTLREETYRELAEKLRKLIAEYQTLSARQISLERRQNLKSFCGIVLADEHYFWPQILLENRGKSSD